MIVMNMISTASLEAAVDIVRKFAADVAALQRAVDRLEIAEKARMRALQLQLWDHRAAAAPTNGHGRHL